MQELARNPRPAVVFHYQIAGRFLSVEFPDFATTDPADRYLSILRAVRVKDAGEAAGSSLSVEHGEFELLSGLRRCFLSDEAGTETSFYSNRDWFEVRIGSSTVRAGHDRKVRLSLGDDLDLQSFLFERVFAHALAPALRRAGAFELHCAAVVDPETSTPALIVGPSGSGKSTLTV